MGTQKFSAGTEIIINKVHYILSTKFNNDTWEIKDLKTQRHHEYTVEKLLELYASEELKFVSSTLDNTYKNITNINEKYIDISKPKWDKAKIKRSYVIACLSYPNTKTILMKNIRV